MPVPIFKKRNVEIEEWKRYIESYPLTRLETSCNKYLISNVLFPWGCTEFIHKCVNIPLAITFHIWLPRYLLKPINPRQFNFIISAREYYVRNKNKEYCWLFNPTCKVKPSLDFVNEKGPCILTCINNNYGTNFFIIHPCRWYHLLPSKIPTKSAKPLSNHVS